MNAIATPDPVVCDPLNYVSEIDLYFGNSQVISASRTGGAGLPGTETYAWSLQSDATPAIFTAFSNPLNASSQRVGVAGNSGSLGSACVVRVTITDSAGNVSTEDTTVRLQ